MPDALANSVDQRPDHKVSWPLVMAWLLLSFTPPLLVGFLNILKVAGFPAGLLWSLQVAPVGLAIVALLGLRRAPQRVFAQSALATTGMLTLPISVAVMARGNALGFDGFFLAAGIIAGLTGAILVAPKLSITSPPLGKRFDRQPASLLASPVLCILAACAIAPLLVWTLTTAISFATSAGSQLIGDLPAPVSLGNACLVAAVAVLAGTVGAMKLAKVAGAAVLVLTVFLLGAAAAVFQAPAFGQPELASDLPAPSITTTFEALGWLPHFQLGPVANQISLLEQDAVANGFADPVTTQQFFRPWTATSIEDGMLDLFAMIALVMALSVIASAVAMASRQEREFKTTFRAGASAWAVPWRLRITVLAVLAVAISIPVFSSAVRLHVLTVINSGLLASELPAHWQTARQSGLLSVCTGADASQEVPPAVASTAASSGDTVDRLIARSAPDVDADADPDWWLNEDTDFESSEGAASDETELPFSSIEAALKRWGDRLQSCARRDGKLTLDDVQIAEGAGLALIATRPLLPMAVSTTGLLAMLATVFLLSVALGLSCVRTLFTHVSTQHSTSTTAWWLSATLMATVSIASSVSTDSFTLHQAFAWSFAIAGGAFAPVFVAALLRENAKLRITSAVAAMMLVASVGIIAAWQFMPAALALALAAVSNVPNDLLADLRYLAGACKAGEVNHASACGAAYNLAQQSAKVFGISVSSLGALLGLIVSSLLILTAMATKTAALLAKRQPN